MEELLKQMRAFPQDFIKPCPGSRNIFKGVRYKSIKFAVVTFLLVILLLMFQWRSHSSVVRVQYSSKLTQGVWTDGSRHIEVISLDRNKTERPETVRILWWTNFWGHSDAGVPGVGKGEKLQELLGNCSTKCEIVFDRSLAATSHAVVFHAWHEDLFVETVGGWGEDPRVVPSDVPLDRLENQFYVLYLTEAPVRVKLDLRAYENFFNLTMTHRQDADIPNTYGRFKQKSREESEAFDPTGENRAIMKEKTDLVAWVASNCDQAPSQRNALVQELQKHVPVHVYGRCGNFSCNSTSQAGCHEALGRSYKFYLAFENSRCEDYVTEKYFDSLAFDMVPVVYGGANYGLRLPAGSFINVDSFNSAKALGHFLKFLDENEEEYLKYFEWKRNFTLENGLRHRKIWCDLCEKVQKEYGRKRYILNSLEFLFGNKTGNNPVCTAPHRFI